MHAQIILSSFTPTLSFLKAAAGCESSVQLMCNSMASEQHLVCRQLFGGAIKLICPQEMLDISDFRPVPDHQEVILIHDVAQAMKRTQKYTKCICDMCADDASCHVQVFADGAKDQSLVVEILVSAHIDTAAPYAVAELCNQLWTLNQADAGAS